MCLGTFNFNINNITLSTSSQPVRLSNKLTENEVKISKFDEELEYSGLAGVKGLSLDGNDNDDPPEIPIKLSPKKSSILNFMERKISTDEAFFSLNK
jgi:hypothetical protein